MAPTEPGLNGSGAADAVLPSPCR